MSTPLPDKLYFKIGEVCQIAQVKPYILRYWETEFPQLKPAKATSQHRLYRRKDVEAILKIRKLLYEEGYTIEGARRKLREDSSTKTHSVHPEGKLETTLSQIRKELEDVQKLLE